MKDCVTSGYFTSPLASNVKPQLQARLEAVFALELSQIYLHFSDLPAAHGAHAVTCGDEIHFNPGNWAPETPIGMARLAHELTHVVQQAQGRVPSTVSRDQLYFDCALEIEAELVGALFARGFDHQVRALIEKNVCKIMPHVKSTPALQPQLVIDSDPNLNLLARTALSMLTAQSENALVYTPIAEGTNVTAGVGFGTAAGLRPSACAVLARIINSAHWVTICFGGNATTPTMWTKDKMWAAVRGQAGFMDKVQTNGRGSSSTITWDGGAASTANYDARQGRIVMQQVANYVTLAHELIHADRIARGTFRAGSSRTVFVIDTTRPPTHQNYTNNGWRYEDNGAAWVGGVGGAWVADDIVMIDDIANCGFYDRDNRTGNDGLLVTENMIRQELNIDRRAKYGLFNARLI